MILILGGESWVDRSSYLGTVDLLQCQQLERIVGTIVTLDIDEKNWYKKLKDLLKRTKLLVVCGGRPVALSKCLGNNGRILFQQWLSADIQHKYLGLCAGVAFARLIGVNCINLINDEAWRGCGLSGEVQLSYPRIARDSNQLALDTTRFEHHYENGPLISYTGSGPPLLAVTFAGDIVAQRLEQISHIENNTVTDGQTQWLCRACTFLNTCSIGKCGFCSESRNYCLPPVGQMPGSIAIIIPTSQYLLSSVHPELSSSEVKEHFIDLLVTFVQ